MRAVLRGAGVMREPVERAVERGAVLRESAVILSTVV